MDNECKYGNEIDCVFKVEGETISGYLKKCFTTETDFINNNYDYYNVDTKLCWASFPLYYNNLTSSNKPGRSNRGNTCGSQWETPYSYHSTNSYICKLSCDLGEYRNTTTNEWSF